MKHERLKKLECYSCKSKEFNIAFGAKCVDGKHTRIIADCAKCGYRISLPADESRWEEGLFNQMPVKVSNEEVRN